ANSSFLYFYDGANLAAFSKLTGSLVAATTVSNYVQRRQGGIAVDECNVIYVGGVGVINTFSFNGTAFSTLTPIPLSTTVALQYVTDIRLNKNTKVLYVSGSGFVGTYFAALSNACSAGLSQCLFNMAGVSAVSTSITCATL